LHVGSGDDVRKAYRRIMNNIQQGLQVSGILVEQMGGDGEEVILGIKRDPSFGPVILFGLGGIFVEVFKDINMKVAPLSALDIDNMIRGIRGHELLTGYRGKAKRDITALKTCIANLSKLAVENPDIVEMDINPLFVYNEGKGCMAADVKIMLS